MFTKNDHPTNEEIMQFVCLNGASIQTSEYKKYFGLIAHFVHCERCRNTKNDMLQFMEKLTSVTRQRNINMQLREKIYQSLKRMDVFEQWKNNKIIWSGVGRISKDARKSVIINMPEHLDTFEEMQIDDDRFDKYYEISDEYKRILPGSEKIEVALSMDDKEKHLLLLIPEINDREPILCLMDKKDDEWVANCDCPEDDYDIVIF